MTVTEAQQILTDNYLTGIEVSHVIDDVIYTTIDTYYGPELDYLTFDTPEEFVAWAEGYDGAE